MMVSYSNAMRLSTACSDFTAENMRTLPTGLAYPSVTEQNAASHDAIAVMAREMMLMMMI